MYFSYRTIDSYHLLPIKVIIGARGIGKTYGLKKKFIKDFIFQGKKFIWLRDNEDAIEKLCQNNGEKFFNDVSKEFNNLEYKVQNNAITINGKHAGYFMSISTYYNYKGNAYEDITNIGFDEFIKEKAQRATKNRILQFINTVETIGRTRNNYKIYMLANALDKNDDFFALFDIKINGFGIYTNKKKGIVLIYSKNNPVYDNIHKNSISGKLINNTVYDEVINNNIFMGDDDLFYNKKPQKCKVVCILHNDENKAVRVYEGKEFYYVEMDKNENQYTYKRFVNKLKNITTITRMIPKDMKDFLIKIKGNSKVRYKDGLSYNIFTDFLS